MPTRGDIHWFVPTMMVGGLVTGTLLSIGHHLFYRNLDHNPVSDGAFLNSPVSKQQANIAIGTAFAFMVKASLVFAVGLAFIQIFWAGNYGRGTTKPPNLGSLDTAYGAYNNFWALFNVLLWWRRPFLLAVASMAWLLPIASIITPATLSIRSAAITPPPILPVDVPNIDFRSLSFVAPMSWTGYAFNYAGPSEAVSRVTKAVLAQGVILRFDTSAVNASWTVDFNGPSLKCDHMSGTQLQRIRRNIQYAVDYKQWFYTSWFPNSHGDKHDNTSQGLPFYWTTTGWSVPVFSEGSLVSTNDADLKFFLTAMPILAQQIVVSGPTTTIVNFTAIECRLVNSTYRTTFKINDGLQSIETKLSIRDDGATLKSINKAYETNTTGTVVPKYICPPANRICWFHPKFFQTLSYQAVMDAFTKQLSGQISYNFAGQFDSTTNVGDTVLMQTPDLENLGPDKTAYDTIYAGAFQDVLNTASAFQRDTFRGLTRTYGSKLMLDLPVAIEELFKNVTVSLMTSPELQPNASSITAPGPVNVTYHKYHNIYVYSAWKLWVPYGIAIGLAFLTISSGFITMIRSQAAYSDNFSTVLRAARGSKLSEHIRTEDMKGQDPLPKYLQKSHIWLPGSEESAQALSAAMCKGVSHLDAPLDIAPPSNRASRRPEHLASRRMDPGNAIAQDDALQSVHLGHSPDVDRDSVAAHPIGEDADSNSANIASAPAPHRPLTW